MKRLSLIALFFAFYSVVTFAQDVSNDDDKVLMTIGDTKVTKGEFLRIYHKNNSNTDIKSVNEYLTLFENFKLKVIEAENQGLDTLKKFKRELDGYIRQLEKPYFTDSIVDERLIKEAYERSKYDVRVSHILLKVKPDAIPADTLKVYKRMESILSSINSGKISFEEAAKKNSVDTYTAVKGGDLGFFTVFQMVYNFESEAYNTQIGKVSKIFRTKFGYHILKVTDKRTALGEVKVAHIMIAVPSNADDIKKKEADTKINGIYAQLQKGADFAELAKKYSDDKGSAVKGGELSWFGTGRMVPEFELAAFTLKNNGEYTKPVKTSFGWHIIKLIDKKEPKSLEDQKEYVKSKLSKDARAKQSKTAVIVRLAKEYNRKTFNKELKVLFKYYDNKSVVKFELTDSVSDSYTNVLMTLGDTIIYVKDFAHYMVRFSGKQSAVDNPEIFVYNKYKKFSDDIVIKYERTKLAKKYPDFKYLVKEYHDGILLFDLTDKMVWSKAVKDSVGLDAFYNKTKEKYMWGDRLDVTIYTVPSKYYKKSQKIAEKALIASDAYQELNKLAKKDTTAIFIVEDMKLSRGDNEKIDKAGVESGIVELENADGIVKYAYIKSKLQPMPKELNEIKGLMTADYQNFLEKEWIKELRNKYKIEVNKDILDSIK